MSSLTWLCLAKKTSKLILCLSIFTVLLMIDKATSADAVATTVQDNQQQQQQQHLNTLADDIEHEEFVDTDSQQPHSRRKRLIWITDDGRLALPPGTSLTFTPTIAMPLVRHPPEGFFSNVSISFPLTIDFDKLGLTDNQNPLGDLPPIFARSFGHTAGHMLGNYMAEYLHFKRKRDLSEVNKLNQRRNSNFHIKEQLLDNEENLNFPKLPERHKHIFHGGERVILYGVVEDFLATFGMDGKACLLRTICEIHSRKVDHFGVFGEMAKLFLTVTRSPFSDLMPEYVNAQKIGEGRLAPAECFPYYKDCPKSIFKAIQNHKYSETQKGEYHEQEVEEIVKPQLPIENVSAADTLDQQESAVENDFEKSNEINSRENLIKVKTKKNFNLFSM